MTTPVIFQNPNYCMGNRSTAQKLGVALRVLANPWLLLFDKLGLVKQPQYRTRSGIRFAARGKTTDVNDAVVVLSGREYPPELLGITGKNEPVIVDAGGHIGTFSLFAHRVNKSAKLFILEPVADNLQLLQSNLMRNAVSATVIPKALYSQAGTLYIDLEGKPFDAGQVTMQQPAAGTRYFTIEAITFADLMRLYNLARIDLLKLDIEGSEYPVLEHSLNDIVEHVHRIIMEFHPAGDQERRDFIVQTLTERGPYTLIYETKNILGFESKVI
jgi:FkbM family methyltransferase